MPYEHVDHTADLMLHCWSYNLVSLLEESILSLSSVLLGESSVRNVTISDTHSNDKPQGLEFKSTSLIKDIFSSAPDETSILYDLLEQYLHISATKRVTCSTVRVFLLDNIIDLPKNTNKSFTDLVQSPTDVSISRHKSQIQCGARLWCISNNGNTPAGGEVKAITKHRLAIWKGPNTSILNRTELITPLESSYHATFVLDV